MTNKRLKKLAEKIAANEWIIKTCDNQEVVERCKQQQVQITVSSSLSADEMITLDNMVMKILEEKENS